VTGCGGSNAPDGAAVNVAATTTQVADWVREVGGDRIAVTQILPPNVDPHEFEPSASDADAIGAAEVVFASGAGLDDWAGDLIRSSGGSADLVKVAPQHGLLQGEGEEAGVPDPHFWHDPTLVKKSVETIVAELAKADPAGADGYEERAAAYTAQLDDLDTDLKNAYGAVPAEKRKMVTDHDAFNYLARRYGITLVGAVIPSLSAAAEPSAKETARLIDKIKAEGVCAVFSESSVDPKLGTQIAKESGATVYPDLYGDTLGPMGSDGATYLGMMRHNQRALVKGFACGDS
jgi:ABC-type Zn uptake system ZnuABC Zn-binding protein ZnuA